MKKACVPMVFAFLLVFTVSGLSAQALSTASTGGKNRVAIGVGMVGAAFEGLFLDTGTVIEDYLYLGVGWNLKAGTLEGEAMQQSMIRGMCGIPVLTQDDVIPVSFLLTGIYEKISTTSDYLDTQLLIRTGTGYEAAVDLYRDFTIGSGFLLRTVLSGVYASGVIITEPVVGSVGSAVTERYTDYLYGLKLGVLYNLQDRLVLSFVINGHLDGAFGIHYGAVFGISAAENKNN